MLRRLLLVLSLRAASGCVVSAPCHGCMRPARRAVAMATLIVPTMVPRQQKTRGERYDAPSTRQARAVPICRPWPAAHPRVLMRFSLVGSKRLLIC